MYNSKKTKIPSNRSFGLFFSAVFLIISLWPIKNGDNLILWSFFLSIAFFTLGILNSQLLIPFNKIWFKFGAILGYLVSPIVMAAIFFFVITPTGIIMRFFGKDLLHLKKKNYKTYWIKKDEDKIIMKNQF